MKNQSGTIKTNLELDRVVMGGSGGYRRLPGGSAHFSGHTDTQTLHHNMYIITITTTSIIIGNKYCPSSLLLAGFVYITAFSVTTTNNKTIT